MNTADSKATTLFIRKELKRLYPDDHYLPWMASYIYCRVYMNMPINQTAKHIGKSRSSVQKYEDDNIREYIDVLRLDHQDQLNQKYINLQELAIETLEDILKNGDNTNKVKVAQGILKTSGAHRERQEIDVSGTLTIPLIKIETEKDD